MTDINDKGSFIIIDILFVLPLRRRRRYQNNSLHDVAHITIFTQRPSTDGVSYLKYLLYTRAGLPCSGNNQLHVELNPVPSSKQVTYQDGY